MSSSTTHPKRRSFSSPSVPSSSLAALTPSSSSAPSSPLTHLSPSDQSLFYAYGIGPARSVPFPLVHHAFEFHAETQPNAIAVEHLSFDESITFGELNIKANRLARRLKNPYLGGIGPGRRVCIVARRSVALVIAILAVLKAGGQYVPLDAVTITDDTLKFVLQDSLPSAVLVMNEYAHRIVGCHAPTLMLEDLVEEDELNGADSSKVDDSDLSPKDGCYCIYTSGTTGHPKGVDVRHQGVSNVICGPPANLTMRPGMRVAQLLNIAFDMGAWEILGSLYNGCTLCIRGNSKKDWIALLKTVHIVIATPTILSLHHPEDYPLLKKEKGGSVIVGGEPCPQALADKWAKWTMFHNCCGPTEISVCNTVQEHTQIGYPLSIGKPIPNTNVYILECEDEPDPTGMMTPRAVPIGQVGSMWVGGIGVSNGYLNLPDKTAERWRKDPFVESGMMFNTGDLGKWRADGQLDHMGRADDQVKVKGFRVELDGVSASMRACAPVKSAVTLLIDTELWGFITPSSVDLNELRSIVSESQPYYAVPNHFVALDTFPTTSNGKVDKRLLRALAKGERMDGIIVLEVSHSSSRSSSVSSSVSSSTTPSLISSASTSTSSLSIPTPSSSSCALPTSLPLPPTTFKVTTARWSPPLTPSEPSGIVGRMQCQQKLAAKDIGIPVSPCLSPSSSTGSPSSLSLSLLPSGASSLSPTDGERSCPSSPSSAPCFWAANSKAEDEMYEEVIQREKEEALCKLKVDLAV